MAAGLSRGRCDGARKAGLVTPYETPDPAGATARGTPASWLGPPGPLRTQEVRQERAVAQVVGQPEPGEQLVQLAPVEGGWDRRPRFFGEARAGLGLPAARVLDPA